MKQDNVFKWYAAMMGVMFIMMAISMSVDSLSKSWETQSAMEHGYEQVETESGKLIWVRTGDRLEMPH